MVEGPRGALLNDRRGLLALGAKAKVRALMELLDRRFLFVVGKGGVGKTTTTAAIALAAARRGKRVLIAMCNSSERLSDLFEVDSIDDRLRTIAPNIDAVNMHPSSALQEYGMMILKVKTLYKAIFENRFIRAFLRGTPGIEAWSMLGKAFYHVTQPGPDGRPVYDLVIVDGPATGHALDMLRVPQVIVKVAPPGLLRREAESALALFQDERRAGVVIVTLPEDMPANETIELHQALTEELKLPVVNLVVNRKLPTLFRAKTRDVYASLPDQLPEGSPLESLALAGRARVLREQVQRASLALLDEHVPVARVDLPHLFGSEFRRDAVESLSRAF